MKRTVYSHPSVVLALILCVVGWTLPSWSAEESAGMTEYKSLSTQFVELRAEGVKTMSPSELVSACGELEAKLKKLIEGAASDPSVKSKSQKLLSEVYEFDGRGPESLAMYGSYLDTLEGWQGRDYAVMAVRRQASKYLQHRNGTKAVQYFELLLARYPEHPSKAYALYHGGMACLESKAFEAAVAKFDALVASSPESELAPWALRRKAYALSKQEPAGGDHAASMAVLEELAEKYPTSRWKAYVCYRKGYTLVRQRKQMEALAEYWKCVNDYPSSPYARVSKKHIAELQEILESEALDKVARREAPEKAPPSAAGVGGVSAETFASVHEDLDGGAER